MITLNLLSPAQKEALRARVVFAMLERLMIALIAALLSGSVLLLFLKTGLSGNLAEVQDRQVLTADYAKANSDIHQLNLQIARVDALQKLAISPASVMRDVAMRAPQGISVTGLDFDVKTKSMRLNGVAARREDLLAFEASMKLSPYVKSLESPISNLFLKTDISFHFEIGLDVEALKKPFEPAP